MLGGVGAILGLISTAQFVIVVQLSRKVKKVLVPGAVGRGTGCSNTPRGPVVQNSAVDLLTSQVQTPLKALSEGIEKFTQGENYMYREIEC